MTPNPFHFATMRTRIHNGYHPTQITLSHPLRKDTVENVPEEERDYDLTEADLENLCRTYKEGITVHLTQWSMLEEAKER